VSFTVCVGLSVCHSKLECLSLLIVANALAYEEACEVLVFTALIMYLSKLECLSPSITFTLIAYLQARLEPA
jgi:hypothetical protein